MTLFSIDMSPIAGADSGFFFQQPRFMKLEYSETATPEECTLIYQELGRYKTCPYRFIGEDAQCAELSQFNVRIDPIDS